MQKKRVNPALALWSAAVLLFVCAFFLGRATVRGPVLETQHASPGEAAQSEWISKAQEKAASAAEAAEERCRRAEETLAALRRELEKEKNLRARAEERAAANTLAGRLRTALSGGRREDKK